MCLFSFRSVGRVLGTRLAGSSWVWLCVILFQYQLA